VGNKRDFHGEPGRQEQGSGHRDTDDFVDWHWKRRLDAALRYRPGVAGEV
jgi:hypothetical protein